MPLFHVHTFIALSIVLLVLFLTRPSSKSPLVKLVGAAVVPSVIFVWLTTDKMHAGSILQWHLGWTQQDGELSMPFFSFWFRNFGIFVPLAIALVVIVANQEVKERLSQPSVARAPQTRGGFFSHLRNLELSVDAALLTAAVVIFLLLLCVTPAP